MALAHYPQVTITPPLRCHQSVGGSPRAYCAAPAVWLREGNALFDDAYFCDAHASASDVPIPETVIAHRVRLAVDVLFSGISPLATEARAEAVSRLQAAVRSAGGVVTVHGATSCTVRYGDLPPVGQGRGPRGGR
jgi:hypothetical protein